MQYPKSHLSYSAMSKYNDCPRRWHFDYVTASGEKSSSPALEFGSAYHSVMEDIFNGAPLQDALNKAKSEYKVDSQWQLLKHLVDKYVDNVFPMYKNIVSEVEGIEHVEIPGVPIPLEVRFDLVTIDERVIDHKTAGRRIPGVENNLQLNLYAFAYYQKNGKLPRGVELHVASKIKKGIEIRSCVPSFNEVMKSVAFLQGCYKRIVNDDFMPVIGYGCKYCSHKEECDRMSLSI